MDGILIQALIYLGRILLIREEAAEHRGVSGVIISSPNGTHLFSFLHFYGFSSCPSYVFIRWLRLSGMDFDFITEFYNGHVPEVLMIVAGIVALLIVHYYRKDDESAANKIMVIIGFVLGIFMITVAFNRYQSWNVFDAVLVFLAGYTLFIRPLEKVNFALLVGLLVAGLLYLFLGTLTGDLSFLATGWPRIIIALVAAGLVYSVLSFLEAAVKLVGKILNCWPILAVFGIICIVEGVLLLAGEASLFVHIERLLAQ